MSVPIQGHSIRGDAIHAVFPARANFTLCGLRNFNKVVEPWDHEMPFACKHCAKKLGGQEYRRRSLGERIDEALAEARGIRLTNSELRELLQSVKGTT